MYISLFKNIKGKNMRRICSGCKEEKNIEEFYKCKYEKFGYDYRCKKCHGEKNKNRWIKIRSPETKIREIWIEGNNGTWFYKGFKFIPFRHAFFDNYYLVLYENHKHEGNIHLNAKDPFDACKIAYNFVKRKKINKGYDEYGSDLLSRIFPSPSAG